MAFEGTQLKVYPSGFLGSTQVAMTQPIDIVALKNRLFDNGPMGDAVEHMANMEVQSLWEDIEFDDKAVSTFEFREKILRLAKVSFGLQNFAQWVFEQSKSPKRSAYQQQWIEETLKYVFEGRPREYTYNVWAMLITSGQHDVTSYSQVIQDYFGPAGQRKDISLNDFLILWVSRSRGIDDIAASLKLLFGKR